MILILVLHLHSHQIEGISLDLNLGALTQEERETPSILEKHPRLRHRIHSYVSLDLIFAHIKRIHPIKHLVFAIYKNGVIAHAFDGACDTGILTLSFTASDEDKSHQ